MTAIEELASRLARLDAQDISDALRTKLQWHVIDTIGAWLAASRTSEGKALIAFRRRMRQAGGDADDVPLDVATNCALVRLSEVDDIHLASMTTPGSIVIPGALTLARAWQADPSDAMAAMLAGYEAMTRLGLAIGGPQILYRGIWTTYFAAPFGMAAVAARVMRLDAVQTAHALALALTSASPGVGHHNAATTSRWFAAGNAARNGLTAAIAAQAGFTSDVKLLESGFFTNVYGITPDAAALTERGGEPMLAHLSFKPWCAARQTMAATEALRQLIAEGAAPDDMTEIRVAVLPPHQKMIDHGVVAGDRASHLTSLPYQMALAAHQPEDVYDLAQSPKNISALLQSFMARIKMEADDKLLEHYPGAWPARISVATPSGSRDRDVMYVPGDPGRPFDGPQVAEKFRRVVAPILGPDQAEALPRRIAESLGDRKSLVRLVDDVNQICAGAGSGA